MVKIYILLSHVKSKRKAHRPALDQSREHMQNLAWKQPGAAKLQLYGACRVHQGSDRMCRVAPSSGCSEWKLDKLAWKALQNQKSGAETGSTMTSKVWV